MREAESGVPKRLVAMQPNNPAYTLAEAAEATGVSPGIIRRAMPTTDPRVFPAPLQETRLVRLDGAGIQAVPEQDEVPPVPDDLAARDEVEPSMGERLRQEQDETGEGETP